MNKGLTAVAAVSAFGFATLANAADLPTRKAPPPPPPVFAAPEPVAMWTGFYVGLNAGGTFGGNEKIGTYVADLFDPPGIAPGAAFASSAAGLTPVSNGAFIGGAQAGYNYQFRHSFVVGLEADIQGLAGGAGGSSVGTRSDPFSPATAVTVTQAHKSLDYLGTVRARIGYLATPTLLLYGTGGLAYGGANLSATHFSYDASGANASSFGSNAYSDTLVGWTAGGGLEWMFHPQWSAKLEYLYYDLGTAATPGTVIAGSTPALGLQWAYAAAERARFDGHIVRAGVNYHFNYAAQAPVFAKY